MAVPRSSDLPRVVNSAEFGSLVERVKRELQVSITPNVNISTINGTAASEALGDYSFKFRCQRSNTDFLITAREMLEQFLHNHNIRVYPSPTSHTHKRGDSFADAFPHFDSKLLSTAKTHHGVSFGSINGISSKSFVLVESADFGRPVHDPDRRLRLASSSPDVKALFNAPAYIYNFEEQDDSQVPYMANSSQDYWTPMPPIVRYDIV